MRRAVKLRNNLVQKFPFRQDWHTTVLKERFFVENHRQINDNSTFIVKLMSATEETRQRKMTNVGEFSELS